MTREVRVSTPHLGHSVVLRVGTSDEQVWADTFTGRYHLPPEGMPAPATVLDLGANIGLVSAHYRNLWPQADVVAVEMDAENAAVAERNAQGVRVVHAAVSDRAGVTYYDDSGHSTIAYAVGAGNRRVMGQTLRKIILRSFAQDAEGGVNIVDFVKMDIEGMEWRLFAKPDWRALVRYLLIELHGVPVGLIDGRDHAEIVRLGIARLADVGFSARVHDWHPQSVFAERVE